MIEQVCLVTLNVTLLLSQELTDRFTKLRIGYPVTRPGPGGQKPATQFMFTLCAGVETLQVFGDAVVDALVVAAFKVQVAEVLIAAPDTTIKVRIATKKQGSRDDFSMLASDRRQCLPRHIFTQVSKKCRGQGRGTIFTLVNSGIQVVDALPVIGVDHT